MWIIGCDFHPRYQQIAALNQATNELVEERRPVMSRKRCAAAALDRIDGWWSHRRIRKESSLGRRATVSWSGEAHALHCNHSGEPFAASRVCDERSGKNHPTALDPAPASQPLPVSLDFAERLHRYPEPRRAGTPVAQGGVR